MDSDNRLPLERRLTRRRFVEVTAGAGATLIVAGRERALAAGQGYTGSPVVLQFWNGFTGGDGPFMRKMVAQFNREQHDITVKMNVLQWADYYAKVPTAVASGRGPDVGIMHVDTLATNAARRVIVPLDDLAKALRLQKRDFIAEVWNAGIYQERRYGIPLDIHPLGFYFNRAHMQKARLDPTSPPQTRDEHAEALRALQKAGYKQPFWSTSTWPAHLMFMSLLWQFGGDLFNRDVSKATWNSDAGVKALTWQVDLVRNGFSPKSVANDAQYIAFKNQKNSFTWDGIWQTMDLAKTDLDWDVAPLPQIGSERAVWAGSHNFVITRQAERDEKKVEAAEVFISWVSKHSIEWAKAGQVPARNSIRQSDAFKALEHQSTLARQAAYVHFPPAVPGIGDAINEMVTAVNKALLLRQKPKAALDQAASRAGKILEENKKKYGE